MLDINGMRLDEEDVGIKSPSRWCGVLKNGYYGRAVKAGARHPCYRAPESTHHYQTLVRVSNPETYPLLDVPTRGIKQIKKFYSITVLQTSTSSRPPLRFLSFTCNPELVDNIEKFSRLINQLNMGEPRSGITFWNITLKKFVYYRNFLIYYFIN